MARDGRRHLFAGGGFLPFLGVPPVIAAMLAETGRARPALCLVPTGDETDLRWVRAIEKTLEGSSTQVADLRLFPAPNVADPADLVASADAVFVGGGSTANMLAVWRAHGLDDVLRAAWAAGTVVGGVSAGAMCWFECSLTDSFGPDLRPLHDGLGVAAGSFCPHFDRDPRGPRYRAAVAEGALPAGVACEDGVTVHFADGDLVEVLAERQGSRAWRVRRDGGRLVEEPVAVPT
ncbi:MAG TPA: peptidase E [Acidimicrobiales bacterium]|nr:peptidase E [Acidimicrobiales bacterium]